MALGAAVRLRRTGRRTHASASDEADSPWPRKPSPPSRQSRR